MKTNTFASTILPVSEIGSNKAAGTSLTLGSSHGSGVCFLLTLLLFSWCISVEEIPIPERSVLVLEEGSLPIVLEKAPKKDKKRLGKQDTSYTQSISCNIYVTCMLVDVRLLFNSYIKADGNEQQYIQFLSSLVVNYSHSGK